MMRGVVVDTTGRPVGLQRIWPMLVTRGALMAGFGILTLVWPQLTAIVLISIFGIYAVIDGLTAIVYGIIRRRRGEGGRGWTFQGVVALAAGLVALIWPTATAVVVLLILGFWAVLIGAIVLSVGLALRRAKSRLWGFPVGLGLAGLIFGIVLIAEPADSLLGLTSVLGIVLLLAGVLLAGAGLRLRRRQLT